MSSNPAIYLVGATGLTGHQTYLSILSSPTLFSSLTTFTRRPLSSPPSSSASTSTPHTNQILNFQDPSTWSFSSPPATTPPREKVFISCLGTQKAIVGSVEEQRKVDLGLNLELAKAAREEGCETYILVSAGGADPNSYFAYQKMKGEIEHSILSLHFPTTLILQPGLLVGDRPNAGGMEVLVKALFKGLRAVGVPGLGRVGVESDLVGKAIASLASRRGGEVGVHYYSNQQIIDLGTAYNPVA